jgi:hypothetical protein
MSKHATAIPNTPLTVDTDAKHNLISQIIDCTEQLGPGGAMSVALAKKFRPKFKFHSKEEHFPCSIEYILKHSALYSGYGSDGKLLQSSPDSTDLIKYQKNFATNQNLNLRCIDPSLMHHSSGQRHILHEVPLYCYVRHSKGGDISGYAETHYIDLVYIVYFAHSYQMCLPGPVYLGGYMSEFVTTQHVTVRLRLNEAARAKNLNSNNIVTKQSNMGDEVIEEFQTTWTENDYEIDATYCASNGHTNQGMWTYPEEKGSKHMYVDANDHNRPIIYVSIATHNFYPKDSVWIKAVGMNNDFTNDTGVLWDPRNERIQMLCLPNTDYNHGQYIPSWLEYQGKWNDEKSTSLITKPWLREESSISHNFVSRALFYYGQ